MLFSYAGVLVVLLRTFIFMKQTTALIISFQLASVSFCGINVVLCNAVIDHLAKLI
jgi:hypothetical protein